MCSPAPESPILSKPDSVLLYLVTSCKKLYSTLLIVAVRLGKRKEEKLYLGMNWTGGALGRSRHAKASVTAIQKAHFAKARARLERTPVDFPDFEIFGKPVSSANLKDEDGSRSTTSHSDSRNRTTFEKPWKTSNTQAIQQRKSTKSGDPLSEVVRR